MMNVALLSLITVSLLFHTYIFAAYDKQREPFYVACFRIEPIIAHIDSYYLNETLQILNILFY